MLYFFNLSTILSKCQFYVRHCVLQVVGAGEMGMARCNYLSKVSEGKQARNINHFYLKCGGSLGQRGNPEERHLNHPGEGRLGISHQGSSKRVVLMGIEGQMATPKHMRASGIQGVMRRETSQDNNNNKNNTCKSPEIQCSIYKL